MALGLRDAQMSRPAFARRRGVDRERVDAAFELTDKCSLIMRWRSSRFVRASASGKGRDFLSKFDELLADFVAEVCCRFLRTVIPSR